MTLSLGSIDDPLGNRSVSFPECDVERCVEVLIPYRQVGVVFDELESDLRQIVLAGDDQGRAVTTIFRLM